MKNLHITVHFLNTFHMQITRNSFNLMRRTFSKSLNSLKWFELRRIVIMQYSTKTNITLTVIATRAYECSVPVYCMGCFMNCWCFSENVRVMEAFSLIGDYVYNLSTQWNGSMYRRTSEQFTSALRNEELPWPNYARHGNQW